ncbi:MAG: hypothetical protein ACKO6A_09445 [Bacteroidota bacterium]
MSKKTAIIIQLLGELTIPLLGYFLWNWSLFFILAYYLIDILFTNYFRNETIRKINNRVLKKDQPIDKKSVGFLFVDFFLELVFVHLFIYTLNPNKSITTEWVNFLLFEDFGIPQVIILLPLLYFILSIKMKQDVLLFIHKMKSPEELNKLRPKLKYSFISCAIWIIVIWLNYFFAVSEHMNLIFVFIIVLVRCLTGKKFDFST